MAVRSKASKGHAPTTPLPKMLNVRALNKLLTENADTKLFPRWFIMTPNGALMAYTTPADIRELRDQVALISMSWKDNTAPKGSDTPGLPLRRSARPRALETLTIEIDNRNLLVRTLEPNLLLVLEGGVPPGRRRPMKVTAEAPGDPMYPSDGNPETKAESPNGANKSDASGAASTAAAPASTSADSHASTATSSQTGRRTVLQIHRKKMDIMAQTIKDELDRAGFSMPDDSSDRFF